MVPTHVSKLPSAKNVSTPVAQDLGAKWNLANRDLTQKNIAKCCKPVWNAFGKLNVVWLHACTATYKITNCEGLETMMAVPWLVGMV